MRILLAGNFKFYIYEEVVAQTLESLGHEVWRFKYGDYLTGLSGKVESYFSVLGFRAFLMNRALLKIVKRDDPDLVIVWRSTLIDGGVIQKAKKQTSAKWVSFNNDDPFGPFYQTSGFRGTRLWNIFIRSIPSYDMNFVYRPANVIEYEKAGSRNTKIFPPYYIPNLLRNKRESKHDYVVLFIGHYTETRARAINYLLDNDIDVKLFGTNWQEEVLSSKYKHDRMIRPVTGVEYYSTISSALITLAFLSKLNRDVYTRRNFEIPACGSCMVSEDTQELRELFIDKKEAFYFDSNEKLLSIVQRLLTCRKEVHRVAENGYTRAIESGYDVKSRVVRLMKDFESTRF